MYVDGVEKNQHLLSVVIPCYNEAETLEKCVNRVQAISDENLDLEIILVDDCSSDGSSEIARTLAMVHSNIVYLQHLNNTGKGAALRSGFRAARGDFVAVQDADLEYNPQELRELIIPLINNDADVVIGSRFLAAGARRVLYFWHAMGNRFLTFLSNMFTDLNLTDMESCYKVFRRDVINRIEIEENRFGVEPEIIAKIAHMRLRIYEIGISYYGRTYEEGKKIGAKDGFRALYCIFHYNAHRLPWAMQFFIYLFIGGISALANQVLFLGLMAAGMADTPAILSAFWIAAGLNYILCIKLLFRHQARWSSAGELTVFILLITAISAFDLIATKLLLDTMMSAGSAKLIATFWGLFLNFAGRKYLVFPEASSGPWQVQNKDVLDKQLV